jgi:lactose/L-arabinose transport system substrate-binding protein
LAGCSGDGSDTPTGDGGDGGDGGSNTSTATEGQTTSQVNPQQLDFWAWTVWVPILEDLSESYDGPHDVSITEQAPGEIAELLTTSLQSQTNMPSISLLRRGVQKSLPRQGGVLKLDDLVSEYEDRLFDVAKTKSKVDGSYYGVMNDIGPIALWYNKNLYDQAGLPTEREALEEEIQTWDDFIQAGRDLESQTGAKMIAMELGGSANGFHQAMTTQLGGRWYDKSSSEFSFNQEANVKAYNTMKDLKEINEPLSRGSSQFWGAIRNENVANICAPAWMLSYATETISEMSGDWGVYRLPRHENSPTDYNARASNYGGAVAGIPSALPSAEREAAKDFLVYSELSEDAFNTTLELGGFPAHFIEGAEQITAEKEFFDNQQSNKVYIDAARACPPQYVVPNSRVQELSGEATRLILQEDEPVEQTLDDINQQMVSTIQEADMTVEGTTG